MLKRRALRNWGLAPAVLQLGNLSGKEYRESGMRGYQPGFCQVMEEEKRRSKGGWMDLVHDPQRVTLPTTKCAARQGHALSCPGQRRVASLCILQPA